MLVQIDVDQPKIDHGVRNDCNKCPVALAVAEHTPLKVRVEESRIGLLDEAGRVVWRAILPPEAQLFIELFDKRLPVAPFSFQLDIPAEFLKDQPCIDQSCHQR